MSTWKMDRKGQLDQGRHLVWGYERDSNEDTDREARRAERRWRKREERSIGMQGPVAVPRRGEQISEEGYWKDPTRVVKKRTDQAKREEGAMKETRQPESSADSRRDQIRDLQEWVERLHSEDVKRPQMGRTTCQDCEWHTCTGGSRCPARNKE